MNGHNNKKNWFANMAFKALQSNPEWAQRFERDFGMSVENMQEGYMQQDEKFCSALKRRGAELAERMPEQFAGVKRYVAQHAGGDNFSGPGGSGIQQQNTTTN